MRSIERLVLLQGTEEDGPQAHHCTQASIAKALRQDFRETAAVAFFRAHVKLLPLVDVDEECGRLWLMQLVAVACLRRIEKVAQLHLPIEKFADPARMEFRSFWIDRLELPRP